MKNRTNLSKNHQDFFESNSTDFSNFILKGDHPCVMAKTVFSSNKYILKSYKNLGSVLSAKRILVDIQNYLKEVSKRTEGYFSFIAVFDGELNLNEIQFEVLLWQQLQNIHNLDKCDWDSEVSNNPKENSFSFSILGHAFYVVGMHPNSSRLARQSPKPALVFNLHSQFEKLKEKKVYDRVKKIIRARDVMKQGSINPMMADFGITSEASQYSGRNVGKDWECPFKSNI